MINLDIVIVNWNTGDQLRECLNSIQAADQGQNIRLRQCIVVDNASVDGSTGDLTGTDLPLRLIRNGMNKGFASACNQGAGLGSSEYILFLNPDCRLGTDSLGKPLHFLISKETEKIGILGIQLVDEKGVVQRNAARFATPQSLFYQMIGLDRIWPHRFKPHFMLEWDHNGSREVDQVTGAFTLLPRRLFDELKGFDDRFFMYFEDLDLALRAKQAGWSSYYFAESQAYHKGGGASYQVKAERLYYVMRSRVLYVAKHFGIRSAKSILVASLTVEFWARILWGIAGLSIKNVTQTLRAYRIYLGTLPKLINEIKGA
jgi:N-acetylglucosaminyl-diphospho-decaprenol L-rhamnosyltransferase